VVPDVLINAEHLHAVEPGRVRGQESWGVSVAVDVVGDLNDAAYVVANENDRLLVTDRTEPGELHEVNSTGDQSWCDGFGRQRPGDVDR
jgi:hypothetical protein